MSLRLRLALILGGIAAVMFGAALAISMTLTNRELHSQVDKSLQQRVGSTGIVAWTARSQRRGLGLRNLPVLRQQDIPSQIFEVDGSVLVNYGEPELPINKREIEAIKNNFLYFRTEEVEGKQYRILTIPVGIRGVQFGRDLTETHDILSSIRNRLGLVGIIGVFSSALLGWVIAHRSTAPIVKLTSRVEEVAATQNLNVGEVAVNRSDEVGRLAKAFNKMVSSLSLSKQQQSQLVSDAGHELRTPLTSLRTNLEVLARRTELGSADRQVLIDSALAEAEELSVLSNELVSLATDADATAEEPVVANLGEFVSPAVERFRRRGITIDSFGTGWQVRVRPSQIDRAMGNLLENAKKWNDPTHPIEVAVVGGTVTVRDYGPGIPPADLPHIFDRFYRAVTARTMPGSGLGLAIVAQNVEANGGTYFARNHPDRGAEVGFSFPLFHHQSDTGGNDNRSGSQEAGAVAMDIYHSNTIPTGDSRTTAVNKPDAETAVVEPRIPSSSQTSLSEPDIQSETNNDPDGDSK